MWNKTFWSVFAWNNRYFISVLFQFFILYVRAELCAGKKQCQIIISDNYDTATMGMLMYCANMYVQVIR